MSVRDTHPRGFTLGRLVEVSADWAAGAACGGILIVVLLQVAGRLLGHPLPWTEEATRFLFIWMVFLGLAAGFRTVESARVVVFLAMLPKLSKRVAVPLYVGFSIGFFLLVGWTGITLVDQQIMMNEEAATLPIPMWLIGLVMPVSSLIAILAIIDSVRHRRALIEMPDPGLPPDEFLHADISMTASHDGPHAHLHDEPAGKAKRPSITGAHYQ